MKKIITSVFIISLCTLQSSVAQITTTFILNPQDEDATVDNYSPGNNNPNEIEYFSGTWTISSIPTTWRNFFKFNLSCIPPNAEVQSAYLSLFYADTNNFFNATDTSLTSSNESLIQRVTSAWWEDSITWNNQPTTTTVDEITLAPSTSSTQDYTNMDVSAMVQQMISFPNENWGFLLRQTIETPYGRLLFASSDNPHANRHPALTVTYIVPTTGCFTLTLDANGEDATVDDYGPGNNNPDEIEYFSGTWTISSIPTTWRNFFSFQLPCELSTATVQSAHLNLYYATVNNFSNANHQSLTHSNESMIQRVLDPWSEHSITWNTQPATTAADQVILPQSTSGTQDYTNIDVTAMVQHMITYADSSLGFLLRSSDETPYGRMLFASGDNPVASKHPTLEICYALPDGISEVHRPVSISLYPNPAHDELFVRTDFKGNEEVVLELTDAMGKTILTKKFGNSLHTYPVRLPAGLAAGLYCLTARIGEQTGSAKVMVQ